MTKEIEWIVLAEWILGLLTLLIGLVIDSLSLLLLSTTNLFLCATLNTLDRKLYQSGHGE